MSPRSHARTRRSAAPLPLVLLALVPVLSLPGCGAERTSEAARESAPSGRPVTAVAPSPRVVPAAAPARRDLERDERLGGHTLARHVAKTDEELRQRLSREQRIAAASTYADRETAELVVGLTLAAAGGELERWLARKGSRPNLVLDHRGDGRPIGRSLRRGSRGPAPCTDAVVVLRWDERRSSWFVLTSYPEASR